MISTPFRLLFLSMFLLASASIAIGCINPIGRSTYSEGLYVEEMGPADFLNALTTHEGKAHWLKVLAELKVKGQRYSTGTERETNTAVAMLHLGMIGRAIEILEKIERTDPGLYYTAANLGTAYELNGENAKALQWIKEGINRNANAHNGSEWLHVKILEAKLALEKDPNCLAMNSVIGMHRVTNEQLLSGGPISTGNLGHPIDLKEVEAALIYQLHERLEFIKPPEGVVANLLFDLSRTLARTRSPEHAATVRAFALTYGEDLMPWLAADPVLPAVELPPPPSMALYLVLGGSLVIVLLLVGLFSLRLLRRRIP